jgi:hypothetical protein
MDIVDYREIRLRILINLYEWFYNGNTENLKSVETIIKETGLTNINRNLIKAEVKYLRLGFYILYTTRYTSDGIISAINIDSKGIDYIDKVIEESIKQNSEDENIKEIAKNTNIKSKMKSFLESGQKSATFLNTIFTLMTNIGYLGNSIHI